MKSKTCSNRIVSTAINFSRPVNGNKWCSVTVGSYHDTHKEEWKSKNRTERTPGAEN